MAKVTSRKETGKLLFDFTYRGVRCREQTMLNDSAANRKALSVVLQRLKKALADGTFRYAEFFPGSPTAARFEVPVESVKASTVAPGEQAAPLPATPKLKDFAVDWVKNHEVEWRRSHIQVLRSTLDRHILPAFGEREVGSITKADILAFRAKLSKLPGRAKETMSNKRINGILAPLRQMLNAAAEEHGFVSPTTNLKPLKLRKTDVEPFTLDEVQSILNNVRKDYRDYFTVRFFTGMRTGEAHGLKWKYVDFENRQVLIRETFVLGEDEYTKTDGSQREIQMNQVVYEALKRQHAFTGKHTYVFCNREGNPLDNKNFTDRVWAPLLRMLRLAPRRPYQMRHTAATLWLASGEAPEWIARQLGHSSTEMLFRVYSRYVPNLTRRDGSAIDRLLATRFSSGQTQQVSTNAPSANDSTTTGGDAASPRATAQGQAPPRKSWAI